jgi:hypothetical protein
MSNPQDQIDEILADAAAESPEGQLAEELKRRQFKPQPRPGQRNPDRQPAVVQPYRPDPLTPEQRAALTPACRRAYDDVLRWLPNSASPILVLLVVGRCADPDVPDAYRVALATAVEGRAAGTRLLLAVMNTIAPIKNPDEIYSSAADAGGATVTRGQHNFVQHCLHDRTARRATDDFVQAATWAWQSHQPESADRKVSK